MKVAEENKVLPIGGSLFTMMTPRIAGEFQAGADASALVTRAQEAQKR